MQFDVDVPLLDPHNRSYEQLESHTSRAHTPLTHLNPSLHRLPHCPQFPRSIFVSVHPPWHAITPKPTPKPTPVHVGVPDGDVEVEVDVNVEVEVTPVAESPDDWLAVEDVIVEDVLLVVSPLVLEDVNVEEVLLLVPDEDVIVEEVLLVVSPKDWLVFEDVDVDVDELLLLVSVEDVLLLVPVDEVLLLVPVDEILLLVPVDEVLLLVSPEDWLVLEDVEDTVPLLLVLEVVSVDLDVVAGSYPHDEAVVRNDSVVVMVSVIVFRLLDCASNIYAMPNLQD
jgi:hypothetical protein